MQGRDPEVLHDHLNQKQIRVLDSFWVGLSKTAKPRFEKYAGPQDRDGFDPLARYLWNIVLAEAFAPTLAGAELMLRNAIHNSMVDETGDRDWFRARGFLVGDDEKRTLSDTCDAVDRKKRNKPTYFAPTADDLVADLPFGFWTALLGHAYEDTVWKILHRRRLSNLPNDLKDRETLKKELNKVREVRNRVAHHEPIHQLKDLVALHASAKRIVGAINAAYGKLIEIVDRFPEVYEAGPEHYRMLLLQSVGHSPATRFSVQSGDRAERSEYEMFDTVLNACAAEFDCESIA